MANTLGISIVLYQPELAAFERTCRNLVAAIGQARAAGELAATTLWLIDNGGGETAIARAQAILGEVDLTPQVLRGQGNLGYGRGHNLALRQSQTDFFLVLNPDVELAPDALVAALRFMTTAPRVLLLAPRVTDAGGSQVFLCKRYPSVLDFLLRGFAPRWLKALFDARLARYEMRDETLDRVVPDIEIVSGCFMFLRHAAIEASGGFDPAFFLYFEDFDLSWRLAQTGSIAYVPEVRIVHTGGHAARKGWHHVRLFVSAGRIFFAKHGWKFW
ncbi:N-acetylglucosaminyl-diphospho-decaprenol L-rhamnosyltransferase [Burkholderiales bacterium]|nr:MAG: glycosyltransferase [Burkholderiales bacterium]CAG0976278.1 N-acetylglucosaminyl-diphospho-decaprenol L-rhamnosyltransferase [Burkholderiales bacterium]